MNMFVFLVLVFFKTSSCLEVEMCPLRGEFSVETFRISEEFWRPGVEKSRDVLDQILRKIADFESNKKVNNYFKPQESTYYKISTLINGVMEERVYSLDKGAPGCADPNPDEPGCFTPPEGCLTEETQLPASILKNLEVDYSCSQAEQIYGIAVQKMHEKDNCRDEPDLKKVGVIWDVCLLHFYPWVNQQSWSICVLKTIYGEFNACYCNKKNGYWVRGFCISKLECLFGGIGVPSLKGGETAVLSQYCGNQVEYILQGSKSDQLTFIQYQALDRFRPRAPYSQLSPCHSTNFTGLFDVGQLILEDLDSQLVVYAPKITKKKRTGKKKTIEKMDEYYESYFAPNQCAPVVEEVIVEDPATVEARSFFTEKLMEKLCVNVVITFVFGLLNGYITLCSPASITGSFWLKFALKSSQGIVICLGLCEVLFYGLTWTLPADFKQNNITVVYSFVVLAGISCFMLKQLFFHLFWTLSFVSIIIDVLALRLMRVWGVQPLMMVYEWSLGVKMGLTLSAILFIFADYWNVEPLGDASEGTGDNLKNKRKTREGKHGSISAVKPRVKGKIADVNCFGHLPDVKPQDYLCIYCSSSCMLEYHIDCWTNFKTIQSPKVSGASGIFRDKEMLNTVCPTPRCTGLIHRILWFDIHGVKINKKLVFKENAREIKVNSKILTKKRLRRDLSTTSINSESSSNNSDYSIISDNFNAIGTINHIPIKYSVLPRCLSPEPKIKKENSKIKKIKPVLSTLPVGMVLESKKKKKPKPKQKSQTVAQSSTMAHFEGMTCTRVNLQRYQTLGSNPSDFLESIISIGSETFGPVTSYPQPRESKILAMIHQNKSENVKKQESVKFVPSGTFYDSSRANSLFSSSSGSLPSSSMASTPAVSPCTLNYITGARKGEMNPDYFYIDDGGLAQPEEKECSIYDLKNYPNISPLAAILSKSFPLYPPDQIDECLRSILSRMETQHLTLDQFRGLVAQELEGVPEDDDFSEGVFESDEDEDDYIDECSICTESLLYGLVRLEPCGHSFHKNCIQEWFCKDKSCPNCRSDISENLPQL